MPDVLDEMGEDIDIDIKGEGPSRRAPTPSIPLDPPKSGEE